MFNKVLGVIPARYGSTRLPGKALKDICGKPMCGDNSGGYRLIHIKAANIAQIAVSDHRIGFFLPCSPIKKSTMASIMYSCTKM